MTGNMFDELFDKDNFKADSGEEKERRWEASTVKHVLNLFRMTGVEKVLRQEHANRFDQQALRVEIFHEFYQDFPIHFGTRYFRGLHQHNACIMPNVINNFSRTPIVQVFEEFIETVPKEHHDGCVGMVFPRRGYQRGMILHTGHKFWRPNVARLVYDYGKPNNRKRLVVEPFGELIKWLAKNKKWSPTD